MNPTRCTLILSIFISTSLLVSGNYVPIIRRTYCIYKTLVFFTLWVAVWSAATDQTYVARTTWVCVKSNSKTQILNHSVEYCCFMLGTDFEVKMYFT